MQKPIEFKSTKDNKPQCDRSLLIVSAGMVQFITYRFYSDTNTFIPYWFDSEDDDYDISLDEVSEFAVIG